MVACDETVIRNEALEEAAKVCEEMGIGQRTQYDREILIECAARVRALKREPNAAGPQGISGKSLGVMETLVAPSKTEPAPAAPVAEMVRRLDDLISQIATVSSNCQQHAAGAPIDFQQAYEYNRRAWAHDFAPIRAALLAKLGQEPVAWRREWEGDISDIGHMIYVDDPHERDEPLSRWQPLYAEAPGASDE